MLPAVNAPPRAALNVIAAFAVVAGLLSLVRPPQLLVTLGPQQAVRTSNELAGVHTRFADEAEAWKIKRGAELIREMGAPWIVEFFPWAYYEGRKGRYDFGGADRIVDHARRQGLRVIARMGFVPEWARPADVDGRPTTFTHLDPANFTDFAEFCAAFAAHFAGRVEHLIIWNEPNLSGEWGLRPVDPAGYAAMLRAVYPAVKRANPSMQVLAGALAPTLEPEGSPNGMNDLDYLARMYDALRAAPGPRPYDAWSVHAYGQSAPHDQPPAPDRINFRRTELLREIMAWNGDADAPVYITEAGWNDDPRWVHAVSPAQRIAYTLGAWDYARRNWGYVRCVAMWVFKLPAPAQGYRDHFIFVTPSLEPLPIYDEARRALAPDGR